MPQYLLSDNATYFVSARKYFLTKYGLSNDIIWEFTTQYAAWRGGVYERTIKNVKDAIKRTFGRSKPTFQFVKLYEGDA